MRGLLFLGIVKAGILWIPAAKYGAFHILLPGQMLTYCKNQFTIPTSKFKDHLQHACLWAELFKGKRFSALLVMKRLHLFGPSRFTQSRAILPSASLRSPDVVSSLSNNIWENNLNSSVFHTTQTVLLYQLVPLLWAYADHNGFNVYTSLWVNGHESPHRTMKCRILVLMLHIFNS